MQKVKGKEIAPVGRWRSNFMRYHQNARESVSEFRALKTELDAMRPADAAPVLSEDEKTAEV
jgi:hypothetical protein